MICSPGFHVPPDILIYFFPVHFKLSFESVSFDGKSKKVSRFPHVSSFVFSFYERLDVVY